ncbi:MAG: asparagine synthase (glutamine-hydrolyzing) [Verrucomicrobia bacterium]|nr:asparagine synthase (glutamine-hydrolyzing) [Verrucomicrobiota bacterium]
MCGIAGKFNYAKGEPVDPDLPRRMGAVMRHRGPDGDGVYLSGPVGFVHRRLAIIDLAAGQQPLSNEDGTVWITFNGEIYNYRILREQLLKLGHKFRTGSDTEVIVHAYEEYGEACVEKLRGMFGFAIWDEKKRKLFMARDRVGIKPLYFYDSGSSIVFGSEIKAILQDDSVPRDLDPESVDSFLSHYYLPGATTLLKGLHRLAPGWHLTVENGRVRQSRYWDLSRSFTQPRMSMSFEDAAKDLRHLLEEAMSLHMISDVPVGCLLSGGIDSTVVLGLATQVSSRPLKTFTIGFADSSVVDERPYAKIASQRFGSEHHEITIEATEFMKFLPHYVWHMEDPVCEPPAIALHYVSQLARKHVKVVLSGEGADEAFAGYPNYPNQMVVERLRRILGPATGLAARGLSCVASALKHGSLGRLASQLPHPLEKRFLSRASSHFTYYQSQRDALLSPDFSNRVAEPLRRFSVVQALMDAARGADPVNRMLYVDTLSWLPDDLLIKADKITMANSLELRVPMLDHVLLERAASYPAEFKVSGYSLKRILKAATDDLIPREILHRKKVGFPVPYDRWMRNEMKDFIVDTLSSAKASSRGMFSSGKVKEILEDWQSTGDHAPEIFCLLILEIWQKTFIDGPFVACDQAA